MNAFECVQLSRSVEFRQRIEYLAIKSAIAVVNEDAGTANHAARLVFAKKILGGTAPIGEIALAVMTNSTIASEGNASSDADLEFTINSIFNAFI